MGTLRLAVMDLNVITIHICQREPAELAEAGKK